MIPTIPPIYVISCRQHAQRRSWAASHYIDHGLDVTIYEAFHGKTWNLIPNPMHAGHIANNMSHHSLWQHCYLVGHEEFLVLEDDCRFVDDFRDKYLELRSQVPDDWQFLTVGYCGRRGRHTPVNPHIVTVDCDQSGAHCYLLRRSAIPALLHYCQSTEIGIDQLIWRKVLQNNILKYYVAKDSLAGQMTCDGGWHSCTDDKFPG